MPAPVPPDWVEPDPPFMRYNPPHDQKTDAGPFFAGMIPPNQFKIFPRSNPESEPVVDHSYTYMTIVPGPRKKDAVQRVQ